MKCVFAASLKPGGGGEGETFDGGVDVFRSRVSPKGGSKVWNRVASTSDVLLESNTERGRYVFSLYHNKTMICR